MLTSPTLTGPRPSVPVLCRADLIESPLADAHGPGPLRGLVLAGSLAWLTGAVVGVPVAAAAAGLGATPAVLVAAALAAVPWLLVLPESTTARSIPDPEVSR